MRMRKKPFARPELEACAFFVTKPAEYRGKWRKQFPVPEAPLYLELGCGKGSFIAKLSARDPQNNYIAIDIKDEMLVLAKRNIEKERAPQIAENVRIMSWNIERLEEMLAPEDGIQGIYINFCNPWPKSKHKKHRLTYPRQLEMYARLVKPGSKLYFKTDDTGLYQDTRSYFEETGWEILFDSDDFAVKSFENNIETEHERMFMAEGKPIKGIIARPGSEEASV
ncbi:MAG: tRNA (guanosine(46)-N7)-methyltransferase TrmB [Clostridia bacterium]|nr:tRNA (guanosine(46)-N7)-methyltransferase TrmB [Clostridia bacterium]